jgi:hypothetical protein
MEMAFGEDSPQEFRSLFARGPALAGLRKPGTVTPVDDGPDQVNENR